MRNILEDVSRAAVLPLLAGSLVACGSSSPTLSQAPEAASGQSLESGTELIVGGELIGLRRAPWIVALVIPIDVGGTVIPEFPGCGGVLPKTWV
ncbi:MAG: hypothetical protein HC921_15915 [Synechococcaceae cyanobacterium SM2_3_1]|nr:hypothetical protein [Synechococcaceae cyanobacterium SM2_3_1]